MVKNACLRVQYSHPCYILPQPIAQYTPRSSAMANRANDKKKKFEQRSDGGLQAARTACKLLGYPSTSIRYMPFNPTRVHT